MSDAGEDLPRAVFDALETGIILLDKDYRVAVWNASFAAMCGLKSNAATGRTLEELFPQARLKSLSAAIRTALTSGVSSVLTHSLHPSLFPLKTRAGRTLVHDVVVGTVGQPPSTYGLVQINDVTVAAGRDRILRERQNARYDAVVHSAPDVILTLDENGIIQLANPAAQRQFGYDARELEGQSAKVLFLEQNIWDEISRAILSGSSLVQPIEIVARRKDGSVSHLEVSLSRWTSDSRIFVTAILRDVNERKHLEEAQGKAALALADLNATLEERVADRTAQLMQVEEALRQSQKMEAVGQLTGGIAHDFNNLLQGIIGSLDRVQKRIAAGRISDVDRFLEGAIASANRAAALTHRLLAFSRRQPVDPKPVDMNVLIGSIEELLRRSIGERMKLKVVLDEGLWRVRCDTNQLENALLNLAINARDAMPDGGHLTIETANIELDAREALRRDLMPGEYVSLRVNDTGVGMPADVRARAFDPFFTTKPMGQGTGLGLSMIYGFVRQSDGSVWIDSEPGQGTTIQIALPRYQGDEAEKVLDSSGEDRPEGNDEIVLVVEDEAVVRSLIVEVLNDLHYHALEAADGPSALRILQSSQRIDLLVTDIGLPGLNGRQLADAARLKRPKLKVLFMTGYAESATGKSFLEPGMQLVTKPFTMDVLATQIRDMIEKRPFAPQLVQPVAQ